MQLDNLSFMESANSWQDAILDLENTHAFLIDPDPTNNSTIMSHVVWDATRKENATAVVDRREIENGKKLSAPFCPETSKHFKNVTIKNEAEQTTSGNAVLVSAASFDERNSLTKVATLVNITENQSKNIAHKIHKDVAAWMQCLANNKPSLMTLLVRKTTVEVQSWVLRGAAANKYAFSNHLINARKFISRGTRSNQTVFSGHSHND